MPSLKTFSLWAAFALTGGCTTGTFNVPDDKFFTDGHALEKNYMQFVETGEDAGTSEPAAQRFQKSCALAENKARDRFKAAYPKAQDTGRRLGEYFEKNGACKVRMAFRTNG